MLDTINIILITICSIVIILVSIWFFYQYIKYKNDVKYVLLNI